MAFSWSGDGFTVGSSVLTSGTTGSVLFVGTGGSLQQDNSNLFWDDSNNYLGIGTASPGSPLSVLGATSGAGGYACRILDNNSVNGMTSVFGWTGAGSNLKYKAISVDSNGFNFGKLTDALNAAPTAQMTIDTNSNVGIGTAVPGARLDIQSPSSGTNKLIRLSDVNHADVWDFTYVDSDGSLRISSAGPYNLLLTNGKMGIGATSPGTTLELEASQTVSGSVSDGYIGGIWLDPDYTAATSQTVTRHNYIDAQNPSLSGAGPAVLTDACLVRFDAAAGTHKAVDAATTKTTPISVDAWVKINVNGTIHFMPCYLSKTA